MRIVEEARRRGFKPRLSVLLTKPSIFRRCRGLQLRPAAAQFPGKHRQIGDARQCRHRNLPPIRVSVSGIPIRQQFGEKRRFPDTAMSPLKVQGAARAWGAIGSLLPPDREGQALALRVGLVLPGSREGQAFALGYRRRDRGHLFQALALRFGYFFSDEVPEFRDVGTSPRILGAGSSVFTAAVASPGRRCLAANSRRFPPHIRRDFHNACETQR